MTTEKKQFDAIIHIGAGRGKELQSHLSEGARRIILVDVDRIAIAGLRRLASAASTVDTAVEVIQAAVAGAEKSAELRIYNLERVSGIREPESLTDVYPGLRLVRSSSHRTREAASLIEDLDIDHDKDNKLVIDAPGEELAILQNLERKGALSAFSQILIIMARRSLYKGAAGSKDVTAFLEDAGFMSQTDGGEEWLSLKAVRARAQSDVLEIERLTKNNANLTAEVEKLKRRIGELEENPNDLVDRKSIFETELCRCEMQIDLLKELLLTGRES